MKSIDELTQEIVTEFDSFTTVDEKYAYLFQIGEDLPEMALELKK